MQGASRHAFDRIPHALRAVLFYLIQWTWGLPQNLVGLVFFLLMGKQRRIRYHGALVTLFDNTRVMGQRGAVSLGTFIFIPLSWGDAFCRQTAVHEYGHTVQSMILGPFYLAAIGLPSIIWARRWARGQRTPLPERADIASGAAKGAASSRSLKRLIRLKNTRYTSRYPENWANRLGEYATGEKPSEH